MSKIGDIGIKATGTITEISDVVSKLLDVLGPAAGKARDEIEALIDRFRKEDLLNQVQADALDVRLDALDKAIADA